MSLAAIQAAELAQEHRAAAAGLVRVGAGGLGGASGGASGSLDPWGARWTGAAVNLSRVQDQERVAADWALATMLQAEEDTRAHQGAPNGKPGKPGPGGRRPKRGGK